MTRRELLWHISNIVSMLAMMVYIAINFLVPVSLLVVAFSGDSMLWAAIFVFMSIGIAVMEMEFADFIAERLEKAFRRWIMSLEFAHPIKTTKCHISKLIEFVNASRK